MTQSTDITTSMFSRIFFLIAIQSNCILSIYLDYDMYYQKPLYSKRNEISKNNSSDFEYKPFLKFNKHLKPVYNAIKGTKLTLDCRAMGAPPPIVYWLLPNSDISTNNIRIRDDDYNLYDAIPRNSIRNFAPSFNKWPTFFNRLRKKSLYESQREKMKRKKRRTSMETKDCLNDTDFGQYTCVAQNEAKIIQQTTIVKFIKSEASPQVCADQIKDQPQLQQNFIDKTQSDNFINDNRKRENSDFRGTAPARIHMWTRTTVQSQGSDTEMFCRSSGKPAPRVTWLTPNKIIKEDDDKYKVLDNGDLVIRNINWDEDMGLYSCLVHNKFGNDHKESYLYPLSKLN
ncbi:unnamed protein product [Gordionus sp. m RMFG-2023]